MTKEEICICHKDPNKCLSFYHDCICIYIFGNMIWYKKSCKNFHTVPEPLRISYGSYHRKNLPGI